MAKGKHSTALFEVINRPARTGVTPPPVITRAPQSVAPGAAGGGEAGKGTAVQFDSDRHQISLRVSYTSALVTLFAVGVVVVLAYVMGRGLGGHSAQVAEETTEELQKGPANASVMDVTPGAATAGRTTPQGAPVATPAATPSRTAAPQPVAASGPLAAPTNVKRIVGQNYIIMQSYPDEDTAKDAQGVLLANGIPCTIEKGPSGWVPMSWFSVVGTQPFDHVTHNPQLDSYLRAVEAVKYGEKSKFKKFDPRAYRWK